MYYSYVEIEYIATSFSPARTDLALKLLTSCGGISQADVGEAQVRDMSRKGNAQDARETNQGKA